MSTASLKIKAAPLQRTCTDASCMRRTVGDSFIAESGHRMQREYGLTPNGNSVRGRWVLRGPGDEWIDVDQYANDLMERHNFVRT